MLRGAFLGFGNVAVHGHVPGWLKRFDIEFVAVSDTDETRRSEAARLLPYARW
jgi:predicted dehydrogenase